MLSPLLLLAAMPAHAGDAPDGVVVDIPVVELPDLTTGPPFGWPSLDDANDVAVGVDRLAIFGVQRGMYKIFPENVGLRMGIGMPVAGLTAIGTVFVGSWAHEEAHRAVLRNRGIDSRNGLYFPEAWSNGTISVDHVSDDDLARLKAEHPAETVRLMSAGIETQHLIVRQIGDTTFWTDAKGRNLGPFYLGDTWMSPTLLAETASTILYFGRCMDAESDVVTDAENQLRIEESSRDFTGLDCTGWVYDMRRPDEPYADRGPHPYGAGVDRYRSWEDLDASERTWLEQQFFLNLLNLANPHLYGIDGIRVGPEGRWIAQVGYLPTPWGYQVDVRGALRLPNLHLGLELHGGEAETGLFPGLDVAWYDVPIRTGVVFDAGLGAWLQPLDQRWAATEAAAGGRVWADVRLNVVPALAIVPGVQAKSEGFVPGNVSLEPSVSGTLALRLKID